MYFCYFSIWPEKLKRNIVIHFQIFLPKNHIVIILKANKNDDFENYFSCPLNANMHNLEKMSSFYGYFFSIFIKKKKKKQSILSRTGFEYNFFSVVVVLQFFLIFRKVGR